MFVPWNDFFAFIVASLNELIETEMAQVRYGDIGLASVLGVIVGVAAIAAAARLVFRRQSMLDSILVTRLIRNIKKVCGFVLHIPFRRFL